MDIVYIFIWWFFFFVMGIISMPLTYLFFNKFIDLGYGFAKTLGLLVVAYASFILSTAKLLPLNGSAIIFVVVLYSLVNCLILRNKKTEIIQKLKIGFGVLFFQEILFSAGLIFWVWVRGHQPDINGLEKFMDFGFINSILRSEYLPPTDMWYAGSPINYYWFGHFYTALATKITHIPAAVTYNFMIATILGQCLIGVFSIVASLTSFASSNINRRVVLIAGIVSAILVTFAGNFHTPFYAIRDGIEKYWYPDATRFIGYNPETNDKTIHEFPLYSFVVSDLHGHLLNLPFVLLYIALLFAAIGLTNFDDWQLKVKSSQNKYLIFLAFVLGVMFMTSTWDFGNYLVLTGVTCGVFGLKTFKSFKLFSILKIILIPLIVLAISLVFVSPFIINFKSIAEGVDFVKFHTPLWQLAILWGFPGVLAFIFAGVLLSQKVSVTKSDLFVVCLLITCFVLIFLPEVIYVKDIYVATHHRANTMFKLTYQAFVMAYITSGYVAIRFLQTVRGAPFKILGIVFFSLIFGSILWYPNFAVNSYYGDLKNFRGLSGEAWAKERYPGIYGAIVWLRQNTQGQPTILEVAGDSYTESNMISSYTGLPTVEGWFVHEWLWRGSSEIPQKRSNDVSAIYNSDSLSETQNLLNKYQVQYIIVSPLEVAKYPSINLSKIRKIAEPVFNFEDTTIYKVIN